jgi:hypothetical protein
MLIRFTPLALSRPVVYLLLSAHDWRLRAGLAVLSAGLAGQICRDRGLVEVALEMLARNAEVRGVMLGPGLLTGRPDCRVRIRSGANRISTTLHFQWIQKLWGHLTQTGDAYPGPLRRTPWVIGRWEQLDESTWSPIELIATAERCDRPGGVFHAVLATTGWDGWPGPTRRIVEPRMQEASRT